MGQEFDESIARNRNNRDSLCKAVHHGGKVATQTTRDFTNFFVRATVGANPMDPIHHADRTTYQLFATSGGLVGLGLEVVKASTYGVGAALGCAVGSIAHFGQVADDACTENAGIAIGMANAMQRMYRDVLKGVACLALPAQLLLMALSYFVGAVLTGVGMGVHAVGRALGTTEPHAAPAAA